MDRFKKLFKTHMVACHLFIFAFVTSLIQLISCEYNVTDIVIRPVSLTTRGAIGAGRVCPPGEVAIGFRLKMENHVGTPWTEGAINPDNNEVVLRNGESGSHSTFDNTALNGVRLLCTGGSEAKSSEGSKGTLTDFLQCQGKSDFIVGAKIKSEKWLGWEYDDIGAVNFEAVCQSGARLVHRPMPSWINNRGEWSDMVFCPAEAPAVCGIKSRVDNSEPNQPRFQVPDRRNDQAGLTEVQLKCCRV